MRNYIKCLSKAMTNGKYSGQYGVTMIIRVKTIEKYIFLF